MMAPTPGQWLTVWRTLERFEVATAVTVEIIGTGAFIAFIGTVRIATLRWRLFWTRVWTGMFHCCMVIISIGGTFSRGLTRGWIIQWRHLCALYWREPHIQGAVGADSSSGGDACH